MKKATLAIAALAACSSSAWAQSSVTLYGIVDVAVRYTNNANPGVAKKQEIPGGMSQSRLGVNVIEDMGGGLKALVNLEHRFNSDTGTVAAADFWRQAWVGLQSNDFGQVRLGRQYNILFDLYTSSFASFRYSPYIEAYKPEIGLSMAARQNNMVKYLAQVGNFYGEIQLSAGEGQSGATAVAPDKTIGAMLRYNDGTWAAGGAYLQATEQTGKKIKGTVLGVSYTDGPLYAHVSWGQNKFDNFYDLLNQSSPAAFAASAGATAPFFIAFSTRTAYTTGFLPSQSPLGSSVFNAASADIKTRNMLMFGTTYQVTPQWNLGANVWLSRQTHYGIMNNLAAPYAAAINAGALAKGLGSLTTTSDVTSKANFFAFVADYAFSKRTDAYFEFDHTNVSGYVTFLNGMTSRNGVMAGLRHRF